MGLIFVMTIVGTIIIKKQIKSVPIFRNKIEEISLNKIEEIHTTTPEILGDTFIAETELDIFSKLKKVDNSSDKNKSNNNDEILMLLKIMDRKIDIVMEYIENMKNSNK